MNDLRFTTPPVLGSEIGAIEDAIRRRKLSGDGRYTALCEQWLEARLGCARALLTHSCTAALEMAALLLDLQSGDEVIMPSFTFSSTANAVVLRGATPVFVDVDPKTMNMDVDRVEQLITTATKAIFAVHYAGLPPDMEKLQAIAHRRSIALVEDAAQSLGSTYRGKPAGTHSSLATISFHETKNIVSGEGGALIVNDPALVERAVILREKGTNRQKFLQGLTDKYTWVDVGSSYLPSELIAAYLLEQLNAVDRITAKRIELWDAYHAALQPALRFGATLQPLPDRSATHNGHLFYVLLPDAGKRAGFLSAMKSVGIQCTFHYVPLHSSPAGLKFGRAPDGCPMTETSAARLVRFPMHFDMTIKDVERVAAAAIDVLRDMAS